MPISPDQRKRIQRLVTDHYLALAVEVVGAGAVPQETVRRLERQGLLPKQETVSRAQVAIQAAHVVGKSDRQLARMTPAEFWQFVELVPPQFSKVDLEAIEATKRRFVALISKLGRDVTDDIESATHAEEAVVRLSVLHHEQAAGIARNLSKDQIARRVRNKLDDTQQRWSLTVATELHDAQEHSSAISIASAHKDALVYKVVQDNACAYCRKLYVVGQRPRLFRLSDLSKNGSNFGRASRQWRPVIGVVHPGCQCELRKLPEGKIFDNAGKLTNSIRKALADELPAAVENLIDHECVR